MTQKQMTLIYLKLSMRLLIANIVRKLRYIKYRGLGYDIHSSTIIEGTVILDKLYRRGVHIGKNTLVAGGTTILSHDHCKRVHNNQPLLLDTYIGERCFIAVNCLILPGVKIGNEVIVGAGSVVTKDIPSNSVAVGNPAKVIKTDIVMDEMASWVNWKTK